MGLAEQGVLASGLDVEQRTQDRTGVEHGGGAAEGVGRRRGGHRDVAPVHGSEQDASLARRVDRFAGRGEVVGVVELSTQVAVGRPQLGVGGGQLGQADGVLVELAPASDAASRTVASTRSSAPRPIPSGTAASTGISTVKIGNRHSVPLGHGRSRKWQERSSSTATSSARTWLLPVPRNPGVCHVSSTVRSFSGTNTTRGAGSGVPSAVCAIAPRPAQALCRQLLVSDQRPRRIPSSTVPVGANIVALPWSASANTFLAPVSGM